MRACTHVVLRTMKVSAPTSKSWLMLSTRHSLRAMRRMLCGGAEPAAGWAAGMMRHQLRYASRHDCRPPPRELLSAGAAAAPAAEAVQRTAAAQRLP